ncbi:hypothetical protein [Nocardioides sp. Arc9.136]|uniref:hypothetical protein n=1 Tax=Nocardioides sp. Arc9.136 TaxID=2996826 RepID=UPI002666195F|nr:hypothetical protein [Nocardioides sp. Arc9.136]WKN49879.1 hypothetical protein OSR43_07055 [Nocardioides sp. Arc9.136]
MSKDNGAAQVGEAASGGGGPRRGVLGSCAGDDLDRHRGPAAVAQPDRPPEPARKAPETPGTQGTPRLVQDPAAPVAADLLRLARAFVAYAAGGSGTFRHGESLVLGLDGAAVRSVDDVPAALRRRSTWRPCPDGQELHGAASCPVDLLGPVAAAAENGVPLVVSGRHDGVVCAHPRRGPLPAGRLVVLRPPPDRRTCASDFALVLAADGQGRLGAVDLTLSDP